MRRKSKFPTTTTQEPEIQQGAGRSKAKDERLKRAVRQHPKRDESRVESVEPMELPPA